MSSCFSLLDLFVLSVLFSVLNLLWIFWCHYVWGVCWGQLTFPLAVRLAVGAIAFASFGKEARETSVQFFSFLFDNVFVEALAFCLQFASIHPRLSSFNFFFLFTALLASFCISSLEILPPLFLKTKAKTSLCPLFCRNGNTINQWNLRNFSAYIINKTMLIAN